MIDSSSPVIPRLGLGLLLALSACAGSGPPPGPPPTSALEGEYVIGSADRLGIHVWKNPELSVEVPVRPDGKISVPLLDDVQAAGLTALELKELLTRRMDEYVSNADITVVVRSTDSKRAYVMGEVRSPGAIVLNTELSILDVLASVGGFDTFADKDNVRIIRRTAQGEVEYGFDYGAYIAGDAPGTNIPILPGDTIIVPD